MDAIFKGGIRQSFCSKTQISENKAFVKNIATSIEQL